MKKGSIFGIIVIAIAIAVIISTYSKTSTYGSFTDAKQTGASLDVVGHLDKKKELTQYIKANNLSFGEDEKEQSMVKVINHYDQLTR